MANLIQNTMVVSIANHATDQQEDNIYVVVSSKGSEPWYEATSNDLNANIEGALEAYKISTGVFPSHIFLIRSYQ